MMSSRRLVLLAGLVTNMVAGFTTDFREATRPKIQPKDDAFLIWFPIYAGLAYDALTRPDIPVRVAASLMMSALWTRTRDPLSLWMSTALAWSAESDDAAIGLYAGWLSVASSLDLVKRVPSLDRPVTLLGVAVVILFTQTTPAPFFAVAWALSMQSFFQ